MTLNRRGFVTRLGMAGVSLSATDLFAQPTTAPGPWDTSWLDEISRRPHRVAFDGNVEDDGIAIDHAEMVLDQFKEVFGSTDDQAAVVVVTRQRGTTMGFSDELFARYPLGEDLQASPPQKAPGRNIYSKQIDRIVKRGAIILVCNNATTNIARQMARQLNKDFETVVTDFRTHLVPGGILVPSGVFAMIAAQNAGCAFMRAS
jgi:intracellular sulfur oxidation DsrE/DsrF family protein